MELSLIARLPSKLRLFIPDGRPFVAEIIVIEMKELKKEAAAVILTIIVTKLNSDEERDEGVSGALQK